MIIGHSPRYKILFFLVLKLNMKKIITIILIAVTFSRDLQARSIFRKQDPHIPQISIRWKGARKTIKRSSWHYNEYPLFTTFKHDYLFSHFVPREGITFTQNNLDRADPATLNRLIEELLIEIKKGKKIYKHFDIVTTKNFNHRKRCGVLVLKFKMYPLVLKLFIETPRTFVDLYSKGFENQFLFYMSGGINRHVAGLTRIKNLELINNQIADHRTWKNRVFTPRKWFWLPQRAYWIQIDGKNISDKNQLTTQLPGTYGIIADAIDTKENISLSTLERSKLIMQLCVDLHLFVDPHEDNFVIKYNEQMDDYCISIVDTEHFPSIVGLKEEPFFNNHFEWYVYLMSKCFQDMFLQTKYDRLNAHKQPNPYAHLW